MWLTFFFYLVVTTSILICVGFTSAENVDNGFRRLHVPDTVQEERGPSDIIAKFIPGLKSSDNKMAKLAKIFTNPDSTFKIADDEVAKMAVLIMKADTGDGVGFTNDEVVKFAMGLAVMKKSAKLTDDQVIKMSKMLAGSKKVKEATKVSDDEVATVITIFKKANAGATGEATFTDDELVKLGKGFAAAQKESGLSDKQVGKLAKMFVEAKQVASLSSEQILKLSQELAVVAQKDKKSWSALKKVIVGTLGVSVGGAVIYATVKLAIKDSALVAPAPTTSREA